MGFTNVEIYTIYSLIKKNGVPNNTNPLLDYFVSQVISEEDRKRLKVSSYMQLQPLLDKIIDEDKYLIKLTCKKNAKKKT